MAFGGRRPRHQIVQREPQRNCETAGAAAAKERHQETNRADEMGRGDAAKPLTFAQCLINESYMALRKVPESTVNQLGRTRRRAAGEVPLIDQHDAQATQRRVARNGRAVDTAADHGNVERFAELGDERRSFERRG